MNSSELLGRILAATGSKATFRHSVFDDGDVVADIDITRQFHVYDTTANFVELSSTIDVDYGIYPYATSYEGAVEAILDEFAFAPVPEHLINLRYTNGKLYLR